MLEDHRREKARVLLIVLGVILAMSGLLRVVIAADATGRALGGVTAVLGGGIALLQALRRNP